MTSPKNPKASSLFDRMTAAAWKPPKPEQAETVELRPGDAVLLVRREDAADGKSTLIHHPDDGEETVTGCTGRSVLVVAQFVLQDPRWRVKAAMAMSGVGALLGGGPGTDMLAAGMAEMMGEMLRWAPRTKGEQRLVDKIRGKKNARAREEDKD